MPAPIASITDQTNALIFKRDLEALLRDAPHIAKRLALEYSQKGEARTSWQGRALKQYGEAILEVKELAELEGPDGITPWPVIYLTVSRPKEPYLEGRNGLIGLWIGRDGKYRVAV